MPISAPRRASATRPSLRHRALAALSAVTAAAGALAGVSAVAAPAADAVVFGTPAPPAPWAVEISTFHNAPGTPCTGVVVAPHWVATAGHCGPDDPNAYTLAFGNLATVPGGFAATAGSSTPGTVRGVTDALGAVGSADAGSLGRVVPVGAVHAPAGDVMLLHLGRPAPAPAVLRADFEPAPGTVLDFYGFGEVTPGGPRSPILLSGQTRVDDVVERAGSRIGRGQTVRGGYGFGDSGGPLFQGDRLVGLHSGSDHAARRTDGTNPAWFETIAGQNAWIDQMIATAP